MRGRVAAFAGTTAVATAIASLAACGSGGGQRAATVTAQVMTVRVSGSGTAMPLLMKLAEAHRATHPDIAFAFKPGTNSGGAIRGVHEGTLDLAVVNRELTAEEARHKLGYQPFARDAIAFAVPASSPFTNITTAHVRSAYGGTVTGWRQLGGPDTPLIVLDRDPDESARKLVLLPVLGKQAVRARTTVLATAEEMGQAIASTPGALGYTAVGYLRVQGIGIDQVRPLRLDGHAPTNTAIKAKTYPWTLTFGVVYGANGAEKIGAFVESLKGVAAQKLMTSYGYAPPQN